MTAMAEKKFLVDGKPASYCDLGYCDVGLDDAWQKCSTSALKYHDEQGNPLINKLRFPDMRRMTAKAHSLGLKAGWYGNNCICKETRTDEYKFYKGDAEATVALGFDSIKLDGCGAQRNLGLWNDILQKLKPSGILIENCHWGTMPPFAPNATWYV